MAQSDAPLTGPMLRAARQQLEWSVDRMADALDVTRDQLVGWEQSARVRGWRGREVARLLRRFEREAGLPEGTVLPVPAEESDGDATRPRSQMASVAIIGAFAVLAAGVAAIAPRSTTTPTAAGAYQAAVAQLEARVAASPENPWAHRDLAVALANGGHFEDALSHMREAGRLAPRDTIILLSELVLLEGLKQYEEAFVRAGRGCELAPQSPLMWAVRGAMAFHTNRPEVARASYERVFALDSTFVPSNPYHQQVWADLTSGLRTVP